MTTLIALAGSLKEQSLNKRLVQAAGLAAEQHGVTVQYLDLADFNIPLFSEDLEAEGTPASVNDLKALFANSQGILLASPEYNGSISGVLKNAIDWLSRPSNTSDIGSAFHSKVVGLMAASPGGLGGIRGLSHTRDILFNLGAIISPSQVALPNAYAAFDEQGQLIDETAAQRVQQLAQEVSRLALAINAG
ncbi:NAD(P)H-dependent oxidoreductase [Dasania sp. GY-MA-18]|uniref:NAD(P)H-dependent oxidoreductase n=1 Tax=Dasania phycosphaerae TaxID=2950436 RepID=A0A9J6RN58_9GAMM|nr:MULTISPECIES: NAD(P)H-dependent oxidoreductase [Dasania]MCR8923529.1 NAD(P)H-dependent oxidoreductase [Dasania sp. GY-MA-18]MCZ0865963.1 NAD(P)H-dependent oxidoreductase [Dasania phycosphaerae]MCZ0869687.1 NAD(P)H-dependent oxidoreductase [Dasania phycosphaerae]